MRIIFVDNSYLDRGPEKFLIQILKDKLFNKDGNILISNKETLREKQLTEFPNIKVVGNNQLHLSMISSKDIFVINNLSKIQTWLKYLFNGNKIIVLFHNEYMSLTLRCKLFFLYFFKSVVFCPVSSFNCGLLYSNSLFLRYSGTILSNFLSNTDMYKQKDNFFNRDSKISIGYIGSPFPKKGFDVFYNIVKHDFDDEYRFVVIGFDKSESLKGLEIAKIQPDQSVLDKILFLGRVNDVIGEMNNIDILAATSPLESFGRIILEAAFCKCLILCSENPGHLSIVTPNVNCFSFPVGDYLKAVKILEDININRFKADKIIANASLLINYYNSDVVCERLYNLAISISKEKFPEMPWRSKLKFVNK